MLSQQDYQAIQARLSYPTQAFINGKFTQPINGGRFATINPATLQPITHIAACDAADVDVAVCKAQEAFASGVWSKLDPTERKQLMINWVKLLHRDQHELAVLESLDSGKPIKDCATVDVPETIACIQWHAEAIDKIYDQVAPTGEDALGMVVREPLGVVAAVLPWNFPLLMAAWKLGPALAAGNSVIVKPAEETSMTCLKLADLAHEAGIPSGVINVLPGLGETCGKALGVHPHIDGLSFTGSTDVGRLFLQYAAQSNLKKVVLECGGKNPCIVMEDAERLDEVAAHVLKGAFWNMGENCSASSRLIVHQDIKPQLLQKLQEGLEQWTVGDPMNPRFALGAMISQAHFDKVMTHIKQAKQAGAKVLGKAVNSEKKINSVEAMASGLFIQPILLDAVTEDMAIAQTEVFGPVLSIFTVDSQEQAIALANNTCYGLAASVFTSNLRRAHHMARSIKAGTVTVNCYGEGSLATPFGGYKQSGFGGRDNGMHAHDQYTELKTIWLDLTDPKQVSAD